MREDNRARAELKFTKSVIGTLGEECPECGKYRLVRERFFNLFECFSCGAVIGQDGKAFPGDPNPKQALALKAYKGLLKK